MTKLLRAREAADVLGISQRSFWRLVSAGVLPQPVKLTPRIVRWRAADIEAFVEKAVRPAQEG